MQKLIWVPSELKRLWGCSDSSGAEDLLWSLLAPFGAETPSGAPLDLLEPLERRLLLEPLWLFWSGGSSSEPLWLPLERRLALEPL